MKYIILILALTSCCDNQNEVVILQDKLDQANKDVLYYKTQYLKANTQLIELKTKCIYCAD